MSIPFDPSTREQDAGAAAEQELSAVILLVAEKKRCAWLIALITRIDPSMQLDTVSNYLDAAVYLTHGKPKMLVLDLALDTDPSRASLLRLARLSPSTVILPFADAPTQMPNPARHGWSWQDAERVLTTSIQSIRLPT